MPDCAFELQFYVSKRPSIDLMELSLDCYTRELMEISRARCMEEIEGWAERLNAQAAALPGWRGQSHLEGVNSTMRDFREMLWKVCASFGWAA